MVCVSLNSAHTVSRLFLQQKIYHCRHLHAIRKNNIVIDEAFDTGTYVLVVSVPWAEPVAAVTTAQCNTFELFHVQVLGYSG